MAAAALLSGMESESASSLFSDVRYYTSPPGCTFFAPLDTILADYDPRANSESTLQRGDVIEVQGPASSGKTQVLQFFAMTTCLPTTWEVALTVRGSSRPPRVERIAIGGREKCAAILDCDGRFSIERSYHLVRSHLTRRVQEHAATIPALYSAEASPDDLHNETLRALSRLHIFTPSSYLHLTATLLQLRNYKQFSAELAFLLIDDISAFYWQDRYQLEQEKGTGKGKLPGSGTALKHVLHAIDEVGQQMGVVTVMTNWGQPLAGDKYPNESAPFYRQHLWHPYPRPFEGDPEVEEQGLPFDPHRPLSTTAGLGGLQLSHHLTLHPATSKTVGQNLSLDNALREEPFRSMEQQEMGSLVYIRMPHVERGDSLGNWELLVRGNVIEGL